MKFINHLRHFENSVFIVLYIVIFIFVGVYFEEGASATRVVTFKGLFTEPAVDWPLTQIYIGHLYGNLYSLISEVPWYGIIDYTLVFSGILIFFLILRRNKILIGLILFMIIVIDDVVMFSFTRSAMLIIGASLLALTLTTDKYFRTEISKSSFLLRLFFFSSLILLGFLNRPQAFIYILCLTLFFLFLFIQVSNYNYRDSVSFFWLLFPLIAVAIVSASYFVNASDDLKESQRLAPKFYNIFGGKFHDEIADISKGDSLALLLLKGNFVNDRNVFNDEFTERITQNSPRKYFSIQKISNPELITKAWAKYSGFYIKYHFHDLIVMLLLIIFLIYTTIINRNTKALLILLYLIISLLSLIIITLIMKMETRISSPVFLFTFVSVLILIKRAGIYLSLPQAIKIFIYSGSVVLICVVGITLKSAHDNYTKFVSENIKMTEALADNFSEHTFIISNPALRLFKRNPFSEFTYDGNNTFRTYEGEAIIYMPSMQKMIRNYCGSLEMEDFFDTMFRQKDSTIYITDAEWLNLVIAYMKHFYHKEYVFTEVPDKTGVMSSVNTNLKFYRPERVEQVKIE
jgi:hypothetical protein